MRRQRPQRALLLSATAVTRRRALDWVGHALLFLVAASSVLAVLFIFVFIARDALPFFRLQGFTEFFTSTTWRPAADPPVFGALAIFVGSGLVTLGAALFAVPLGVLGAICLSDILPFSLRQIVKPIIEVLAAIPSVAFGFFALVVLAPLLQERGGLLIAIAWWAVAGLLSVLFILVTSDYLSARFAPRRRGLGRALAVLALLPLAYWVFATGQGFLELKVPAGANALNVSLILGIMALPTVISVSEDALQAVGRELREGAYALGSTRAETLIRVVLPAASSGIAAAVILGVMRAIGETMVVWMASGNAAQIPEPWYNFLAPVRTLTATIAGDMGEADHVTGSARYHVLWALALSLLLISFVANLVSERLVRRAARKLR
ncbi:MAG: phosphate ABC transporter permease subunit PstC [Phycisphaerales bacterium]|nr:phosphate ABC transporter permease subunit PstC [Phycisphaerales bacterium]